MAKADDLAGRLILITGASRGLGRAVALACAEAGAELIITARTTGALEELDDEIKERGGQATLVEMDVTDLPAIVRLAGAIAQRWGRLDGFVANAGQLGQMAPMAHSDPEIFERTLQVNLTSVWHQLRAFDPLLRAAPAGRAVLVTSGAALGARPYWGAYAVSKAGLESMGRAWAAESEQTNLRINLLDPGLWRQRGPFERLPRPFCACSAPTARIRRKSRFWLNALLPIRARIRPACRARRILPRPFCACSARTARIMASGCMRMIWSADLVG